MNQLGAYQCTKYCKITMNEPQIQTMETMNMVYFQGSSNSHAIKKKDELERVAKSNR